MARDQWSVAPNPQWSVVFVSGKRVVPDSKAVSHQCLTTKHAVVSRHWRSCQRGTGRTSSRDTAGATTCVNSAGASGHAAGTGTFIDTAAASGDAAAAFIHRDATAAAFVDSDATPFIHRDATTAPFIHRSQDGSGPVSPGAHVGWANPGLAPVPSAPSDTYGAPNVSKIPSLVCGCVCARARVCVCLCVHVCRYSHTGASGKSVVAVLERDWTSTNPSRNLWTPMALTPEGVAAASFGLLSRPWAALNTT